MENSNEIEYFCSVHKKRCPHLLEMSDLLAPCIPEPISEGTERQKEDR